MIEITTERRHEIRYYVQHVYIPEIVRSVNDGYLPYIALFPSMGPWYFNIRQYFEHEEIQAAITYESFEKRELGDDYMLIIYTFPEPAQVSEAAYGAVLLDRSTNQAVYYMLEASHEGKWAIGSKTTTGHSYFEFWDSADKEMFAEWVMKKNPKFEVYKVDMKTWV